jgi:hypothetical protein
MLATDHKNIMPRHYLLGRMQIAASHTEITGGADHTARQSKGVVGEDRLGSTVVILS